MGNIIGNTIVDIEEELSKEGQSLIQVEGWMHVRNLFTHIQRMVEQSLGQNGEFLTSKAAVRNLVESFVRFTYILFDEFSQSLFEDEDVHPNQQRYHQHQMIERLHQNWEIVEPLLAAVNNSRVGTLEKLVTVAKPVSGRFGKLKANVITVPYFGRRFELVRFEYAPDIFITGVPLYNLESPWDFQVIWHEMAGHVIRQLEEDGTIKEDGKNLSNNVWNMWKNQYFPENGNGNGDNDQIPWEEIDRAGWVAELIEDSYSTLSLGPIMLATLERVLRQHYEDDNTINDERHPPPSLRLAVTRAILLDMGFSSQELGLTEQQIDESNKLEDVAKTIRNIMEPFVDKVYSTDDEESANALKDIFLDEAGHVLAEDLRIPHIISAVWQAFESGPSQAKNMSGKGLVTLDSVQIQPEKIHFIDPDKRQFNDFFKMKPFVRTWQQLLEKPFQEFDLAIGYEHTSHTSSIKTARLKAHGRTHRWRHSH